MTDQTTEVGTAAPPRSGRTAVLVAVALASLMLPMAVTAPAVALGDMAADLNATSGEAQWVLNAYNVTFAAFMLAAGGMADLIGRRRVLTIGVAVFATTSLLCAVIANPVVVDVLRGIQGIGSAGILTTGAAILANAFTGAARARAFGVLGASFGFGLALGPLLGGALVDAAGWRSVFLINVVRTSPPSRRGSGSPELEIPYHVVGGTIPERLERIATTFDLPQVMSTDEAVRLATAEYGLLDVRDETERAGAA